MTAGHRLAEVRRQRRGFVFACECQWSTPVLARPDAQDALREHIAPTRTLAELVADAERGEREMRRSWWNWVIERERAALDAEGRRAERMEAAA